MSAEFKEYLSQVRADTLDRAISALIGTGDINLVNGPRVKTSLVNYLGQLEADMNEIDSGVKTNRIWNLEQVLVATEELSGELNTQSDS